MTLKELCKYFKENQSDSDMCEYYKNEYLRQNKDKYNYEHIDESDIQGLRVYLACWILAIYEYLLNINNAKNADWLHNYDDVTCQKEDNDYYIELTNTYKMIHNTEDSTTVDKVFQNMLEESLSEFKKRNIPLKKLYNNA